VILEAEGVRRGMIHCFTGDTAAARRYLDLGFHLSISGVVTYSKTEALQAAVRFAPLDRLLVETDSPYLSPVPRRGKWPNEPRWVAETAKKVAALKALDPDEVALRCAQSTAALLGLRVELPASQGA
jgi:TatD DNase family protein